MTEHSLFISDLHLASERPRIVDQFFAFLAGPARDAAALYVLGDLFEYWAGDDDIDDPLNQAVAQGFSRVAAGGTDVLFMHGNRDFLVGREFAKRASARLLDDPTITSLHGTRTLLMHGDTLCTDDVEYQKFRAYARNPQNQARFLAQPIAARHAEIASLRARNETAKQGKASDIMDVNAEAVREVLRQTGYPRLIHGHTHRPGRHVYRLDGNDCERWVLGDWYDSGSYLRVDADGCTAIRL